MCTTGIDWYSTDVHVAMPMSKLCEILLDNTALIDEVKKGLKSNLELELKQIELLDTVLSNKVPVETSQLNCMSIQYNYN